PTTTSTSTGLATPVLTTGTAGVNAASGPQLDTTDLPFQVLAGATGNPQITLLATNGTFVTGVDNNGTAVPLTNPTTNTFNSAIDTQVKINVNPNQPPFDSLPSGLPAVLFKPANHAGLQTATPNKEVFSTAGGDAITVVDPNVAAGNAETETTVLTLQGASGTSAPVGTLTLAQTTNLTVTGNGTSQVTLVGALADINNALN